MKLLDNISVRGKLLLISLPLAFALIISVIFMAVEINSTEKEVSDEKTDILPHVPPDVAGLAGRTF